MSHSEKPAWKLTESSIHACGMFAARDIDKGERIIEYLGERISKDTSLQRCLDREAYGRSTGEAMVYIFDLNETHDLDGDIADNPAKYINHSCNENCEAINEDDRIFIYAKKAIAKGKELTFDYGYDVEHYKEHPCRCGSKQCVGYIVAKSQRKQLKQLIAKDKKKGQKKTKKKKASRSKEPVS